MIFAEFQIMDDNFFRQYYYMLSALYIGNR